MGQFIEGVYVESGLTIVRDSHGGLHIFNPVAGTDPSVALKVIQGLSSGSWPNNTAFHLVVDSITGLALNYIVPSGNTLHLSQVVAAQSLQNNVSEVGIFVDGTMQLMVPLGHEVTSVLPTPLNVAAGSVVEIKFKPALKSAALGVTVAGYLD